MNFLKSQRWSLWAGILGFGLYAALFLPVKAQQFSLETVMSSPFPSGLVASPKGDSVAWIYNEQGKRNIWVAKGPDYKSRQLTSYSQDNGQEIANLTFNFDGSIIVFVMGQGVNRAGEYPNPTSNPQGVEQAVWAVKVDGGEPWRIGEGTNPVTSTVENRVAYILRGKMFLASLSDPPQPQILFKARGTSRSPAFSPDGSKLAFVSSREDHSFIGLYDLKKKSILWIAPTVDRDGYPVWSPDSRQIAFIRFPGTPADVTFSEGQFFSIYIADGESGEAKEVWRSPNATGGFVQYYPTRTLMWAAQRCLLFYSEHEGWMHIYSLSLEDGKVQCLTPGEFEAEDCCLTPDLQTLIFNSNSGDIDRRHLWAVSVTGGLSRLLTQGKGMEWAPVVPAGGSDIVYFCSTSRQPAAPAAMTIQGKNQRLIAPEAIPASFPAKDLVEPKPVIFKAPDGLEIHGQLFLPKDARSGDKRPAVIFMHGGPIRQMLLGWHMRGYYHNAYALNQYLAHKGYIVLSVNYRSGIGYGRAFRAAPNQGAQGASEYQDIVAAGKYLQNRPEVDPNKIGLWGGSYGGFLTALGLARDSELFAAGVDLHGVHDWSLRFRRRDSLSVREEERMRLAYDSSPVADVDFWTSPVLFIHGDDDRNVDFIQTTDLVQRLRKLGKAHLEILVFPDEVHGFLLHARWLEAFKAAVNFFDRFLRGETKN
ncbi:MAG: prolyl oligopeptidase family serine peptidase [Candidatus Aminicenantales bacterium]